MEDFYSKCGMPCNRCPWSKYVRETMTDEEYRRFTERCKEVLGYRPTEAYQNCVGCQTPDEKIPKEARIPLRNCPVRQCVDKAGIENCAFCSRFPCDFIKDHATVWSREKIEKKRGKPVSKEDYLTFVEPFEGLKHLEKIRATLSPNDIVEVAKIPPLKTKIVELPEKLSFPKEEMAAFKAVHGLLATLKRSSLGLADTDTFAQQLRLKRRMPYFLRFLWIFGRFGEFKEGDGAHLVVDAKAYMDNRGSEKTLGSWSFVEDVILKFLAEFGIRCERVALEGVKEKDLMTPTVGALRKQGWVMTMAFDEAVGGVTTLKALQIYATKLDDKYGKKAFRYFSNVDMRVFGGD